MGLEYFIDPNSRERFGPLIRGAASLFRPTPYTAEPTKQLLTSAANIGSRGAGPVISNLANFLTTGVTQFLEATGPIGAGVSKLSRVGSKVGKKVDEILENFVKEGSTTKARHKAFDALGIERIKKRGRFTNDMARTIYKIKYPDKPVPKDIRTVISRWSGDEPLAMSKLKKIHHQEGLGYAKPGWRGKIATTMTKRKKAKADRLIKKMKNMSEAEQTKEMLKIKDQGVLHRVKSHFPTGATKLKQWRTPEERKIYEIVRKRLIEEKGLDPADIHQAHGLEEMLYKLFPEKLRGELSLYRVPTENLINQFHDQLNKSLYRSIAKREDPRWLKKKIKQKKFNDVKTLDKGIESMKRMIKDLKLETPVLSKKTQSVDWISPYEQGTSAVYKNIQFKKDYDKLVQRLPIKQKGLKKISPVLERLRHGGIASISHLTRPI